MSNSHEVPNIQLKDISVRGHGHRALLELPLGFAFVLIVECARARTASQTLLSRKEASVAWPRIFRLHFSPSSAVQNIFNGFKACLSACGRSVPLGLLCQFEVVVLGCSLTKAAPLCLRVINLFWKRTAGALLCVARVCFYKLLFYHYAQCLSLPSELRHKVSSSTAALVMQRLTIGSSNVGHVGGIILTDQKFDVGLNFIFQVTNTSVAFLGCFNVRFINILIQFDRINCDLR